MSNLADLRNNLTSDDIKDILSKLDIECHHETDTALVYPTYCHNVNGGSPKLYYYKNTHLFMCYTGCAGSFDIFEMIIKVMGLRGYDITLSEAVEIAGLENDDLQLSSEMKELNVINNQLTRRINATVPHAKTLEEVNINLLQRYTTNLKYLEPWLNEGISIEALRRYDIMYDTLNAAVVIPHRDKDGRIVGVRGRFMDLEPGDKNKYMPLQYNNEYMAHRLRDNLYGLMENKEVIKRKSTVILFEAEKSVLKMDTFFTPEHNFSVAVCGHRISEEQISLLLELNIKNVVLAFDRDYTTYEEQEVIRAQYNAICKKLSVYFNTSMMFDTNKLLDYKDSPIDQGKLVFLELFRTRNTYRGD